MKRNLLFIALIVTVFVWSTNFILGDYLLNYFTPIYITTLRFTFAMTSTLVILLARREFVWIKKGDILLFLILGNCGIGLYNAVIYGALNYTSPVNSSLIKAINPVVTIILSGIILKSKASIRLIVSTILTIVGVYFVLTNGHISSYSFNPGDVLMLASVLMWSIYCVKSQEISKRLNPIQITFWATVFGVISIAPVGIFQRIQQGAVHAPLNVYVCIAYLGVVGSSLGMIVWQKGLKELGANIATIIYNLIPLYTVILSVLLYKTKIQFNIIFGGLLIIIGALTIKEKQ